MGRWLEICLDSVKAVERDEWKGRKKADWLVVLSDAMMGFVMVGLSDALMVAGMVKMKVD